MANFTRILETHISKDKADKFYTKYGNKKKQKKKWNMIKNKLSYWDNTICDMKTSSIKNSTNEHNRTNKRG